MRGVDFQVPSGTRFDPEFLYEAWTDSFAQSDYMAVFGVEGPSTWNGRYRREEHGAEHSYCLPE